MVTAGGGHLTASPSEDPDLFWALRGGGGNFGIVTSFEYRLAEVGPTLLAGLVVHPLDGAVYVNFLGDEGQDRVRAAYGDAVYDRLSVLKSRYDPDNFFRVNQNITPAGGPR